MFDHIVENSGSRQLLFLTSVTLVLSQLESWNPWIAGLGSFPILMGCMGWIAVRASRRTTLLLGGIASLLATVISWFPISELSSTSAVLVSVVGTASLISLSWTVNAASLRHRQRIAELELQQSDLVRQVYDYDRASLTGDLPQILPPVAPESRPEAKAILRPAAQMNATPPLSADHDFFDFARLLLSMQQIGHRLSSQLDLQSLAGTIVETAKEVLHCRDAELLLWNSRESRLNHVRSTNSTESGSSTLHDIANSATCNAVFDWVVKNRRIITRREVASGKLVNSGFNGLTLPTAVAPLLVGEDLVGLLEINDAEDDGPTFVRMLFIFASHCALGIKNAQLFRHIDLMARQDSLTGLLNHRAFLEEIERLVDEAHRIDQPLTLVMSDVDHFKNVNDTYGHQAGDRVLQEIACWWQAVMPDRAVLARYGGEEFICALPGDDLSRGCELAELLRTSLQSNPISHGGHQVHVTASFGVAQLDHPAPNAVRLIRLADKALYRAKSKGRNRIESHDVSRFEVSELAESTPFVLPQETFSSIGQSD